MGRDLEWVHREEEKLTIEVLPPVDPSKARFPCCLVWTPLPIVAWLVPFIGHLGIAREDGVILDFAGAYFINVDNFAFGAAARYVPLDPGQCCFAKPPPDLTHTRPTAITIAHVQREIPTSWDDALRVVTRQFQHISYNIFTCNCHSFVARCLNAMEYRGRTDWNMVDLVVVMVRKGRWVSVASVLQAFLPFLIVAAFGHWAVGSSFFMGWAVFSVLLVGWFLVGTYFLKGVLHS